MVVVPLAIPSTVPLVDPIDPTPAALLLHVPPVIGSLNVVVAPIHTALAPVIAPGLPLTVTIVVA